MHGHNSSALDRRWHDSMKRQLHNMQLSYFHQVVMCASPLVVEDGAWLLFESSRSGKRFVPPSPSPGRSERLEQHGG